MSERSTHRKYVIVSEVAAPLEHLGEFIALLVCVDAFGAPLNKKLSVQTVYSILIDAFIALLIVVSAFVALSYR